MRKLGDNKQSSDMVGPLSIQSTIKVWCLLLKDRKIGIYIICEQNDPCSGCYQFVSRVPNVLCLPAFQRHAAKARLLFLEMGT